MDWAEYWIKQVAYCRKRSCSTYSPEDAAIIWADDRIEELESEVLRLESEVQELGDMLDDIRGDCG